MTTIQRSNKPKRVPAAYPVEGYEVASWYDGSTVDTKTPCTQVHLLVDIGLEGPLIMRFKSREAVTQLIAALLEHRNYVWNKDGSLTGNR